MHAQSHREAIENNGESKMRSRKDLVELMENREYGEFSWRA
jgi:hypothetical protein